MSISAFVADLPVEIAKRVCVIREDMTQSIINGEDMVFVSASCPLGGPLSASTSASASASVGAAPPSSSCSSAFMHNHKKEATRYLIRESDVAMIFGIEDVRDVSAILYEDQKQVRTYKLYNCNSNRNKNTTKDEVTRRDTFLDDRGFIRVVSRLAVDRLRKTNVGRGEIATRQEDTKVDVDVDVDVDEVEAETDTEAEAEAETDTSTRKRGNGRDKKRAKTDPLLYHRAPYVKLSPDMTRIDVMYADKSELVRVGNFRSRARAMDAVFENGGNGIFRTWSACPDEVKRDFLRRGGRIPFKVPKKSAKSVEELDGDGSGRVKATYGTMTEASLAAGTGSNDTHAALKRAISHGEKWKGSFWRFATFTSTSAETA